MILYKALHRSFPTFVQDIDVGTVKNDIISNFCDFPVVLNKIKSPIIKLKGNRAIGPDGVPGFIINGKVYKSGSKMDIKIVEQ